MPSNNGAPLFTPIGGSGSPLTTKGDIYVYSTANDRLPVGTNGQVLKADSSQSTGLIWGSASANLAVRSVTTTDTCTSADDVLVLSGASFTETLFTAAGNTGKVITLLHNGTTLTQVYTLNTTSSQTIGGIASGVYKLYTKGETLKIVSDGSNWLILDHKATTAWADYTPTLTGFGTVTSATYKWRRIGTECFVKAFWTNGTVAASTPKITLPGSMVIDTAQMLSDQTEEIGQLYTVTTTAVAIPSSSAGPWPMMITAGVTDGVAFSSTADNDSGHLFTSELTNAMTVTGAIVGFKFNVPISGWQP